MKRQQLIRVVFLSVFASVAGTTALVTSLNGVTPLNFLDNPYPTGVSQPTGGTLGAATLLGQNIRFTDRNIRQSYSAQWNLNIQRELPWQLLVEAGYVGNRGLKLQQDLELNLKLIY